MVIILIIIVIVMYQRTEDVGPEPVITEDKMSKYVTMASGEGTGEANEAKRVEDPESFERQMTVYKADTWIVDEIHKMAFCSIPKNSCSKFKMLFHTLSTNGTRFQGEQMRIHGHMLQFGKSKEFLAETLIKDPSSSWRTFEVIRDPAERMVSGFMDKCVRDPRHWCEGSQLNESDFSVFADRIIQNIESGHYQKGNGLIDHFRPQHMICGQDTIYPKYVDDIIVYNKSTVAEDTLKYLRRYNLEEFNEGYGEFRNETLFAGNTIHSMRREEGDCAFYSQYFDADLYKRVRTAFDGDYSRFQLEDPKWSECLK